MIRCIFILGFRVSVDFPGPHVLPDAMEVDVADFRDEQSHPRQAYEQPQAQSNAIVRGPVVLRHACNSVIKVEC